MALFTSDLNNGVATDVQAITPNDTTEQIYRMIYVTGAGDLAVTTWDGSDVTVAVPAGYEFKCAVRKVKSTGTTATGLIGFK